MAMGTGNGQHGEGRGADCAAHDLKDLMSKVMDQIADADRRNGDLLRQMQDRLQVLGQQARASRPSVPSEYLPGFDRIEDGMSILAHRIAETYTARGTPAPAASFAPGPMTRPPVSTAEIQAAVAAHLATTSWALPQGPSSPVTSGPSTAAIAASPTVTAHVPAAPATAAVDDHATGVEASAPSGHEGYQPQPLRSANAGVAATRNGKYAAHVDTFDVVETVAGNPAEPWSPDQVAALSQIYQHRETLFSSPTAQAAEAAAVRDANAATGAQDRTQDRTWLEGRLTEISGRIEQSLSGARPDHTIAAIERRFNDLEYQMTQALRGLATVSDVSGLHGIETQIQELNGKFDHVSAELMRLHSIEAQLGTIINQVSDERLSSLVDHVISLVPASAGGAAAPAHSNADFQIVAIAAAEAAASRVVNAQRSDVAHKRVDDVHAMLSNFIDERRQDDEHTASALDTLQQAMLSMLDRMEQFSEGQQQPQAHVPLAHAFDEEMPAHREAPQRQPEAPPAPPLRADPLAIVEPQDAISRQRADLQASAQRAAIAQREKLKSQVASAPVPAARKQAASSSSARRLMVSGVALATAFTVGAGALFMWMPTGAGTPAHLATAPVITKPDAPTVASTSPTAEKLRGMQNTNQMAKAAPVAAPLPGLPEAPRSIPETVTDDIGAASEVPDVNRVPERGNTRANLARSSFNDAAPPLSGIMIQGGPQSAVERRSDLPASDAAATAVRISTNPLAATDPTLVEGPTAVSSARAVVEMPPATVGPNSLRIAAAGGDASAEFEVASRLAEGKGTDQNLAEAVRWYQRAATKGFAQAQYRLGTFLERGLGMKSDIARARSWYQRAAEQGNVKAMHNLAVLSAGRASPTPDYATAAQWFTQAANYGLSDSQFNLAVLTESGLGVEKDPVQATMWFILAAQGGDKEAIRRRDAMKSKLDKSEYSAAEHLAKTWQSQMPDKLANDPKFAGEAWKARQAAAQE